MGTTSKQSIVLPHVRCARQDARLDQRHKNTKARENLKKISDTSTTTQKLQLWQELNNIRQMDMSITDYTIKIKEIYDAFWSINVMVEEDEMVQFCLADLV